MFRYIIAPFRKLAYYFTLTLIFFSSLLANQGLDPQKQITQYMLDIWQTDEGLPQNSIQAIIQDQQGYLILATQEGMARFDGIKFDVFNKKNIEEIKNNYITTLCESSSGDLWLGTDGGGVTLFSSEGVKNFTKENGLPHNFVEIIYQDRENTIWIGTDGGGLCRYNGTGFTCYSETNGLPDNRIRDIYQDKSGTIWLATSKGLIKYRQGIFSKTALNKTGPEPGIWKIAGGYGGSIWVGTDGSGLFNVKSDEIINFRKEQGLTGNTIRSLYLDNKNVLWIGTITGLNRLRAGKIEAFTIEDGLSNNNVTAICQDREGSVWIGTNGGGLNRLRDGKFVTYTHREGLSNDFIWTVFQDSKDNIWLGTDGGGLNRIKDGKVEVFTTRNGLGDNVVFPIMEDFEGTLWIGTNGGGVSKLRNGSFSNIRESDGLLNGVVKALCQEKNGRVWIGTTKGINIWEDGKLTDITYNSSNGLGADYIRTIYTDSKNRIWIGTRGGGITLYENGSLKSFTAADGLSNNIVRCFYEDKSGAIWVGTSSGLNRIKNGIIKSVLPEDGLFDDPVFSILEDREQNFWMSCNKGVYYINLNELNDFLDGKTDKVISTGFGKSDGMINSECNGTAQPAGFRDNRGRLWFPTIKGVVSIDPGNMAGNNVIPPVVIEKIIVDDSSYNHDGITEIEAGSEKFEFHYTALSFQIPKRVEFKYMLEGFDDDWIKAGNRRIAYYTNIPPGDYTFKVIAANNDGLWNEEGAKAEIDYAAYFYETVWFWILISGALLFTGFRIYRFQINKMKAHNAEIRKQYEESEKHKKLLTEKENILKEQIKKTETAMNELGAEKKYLAESVEKLLNEIEKFSSGDLTVEISSGNNDDIGKLYSGFNKAVAGIRSMLESVRGAVDETINSNNLITEQTGQIAEGIRKQNEESEAVASSVEEMTVSIHQTTENAEAAANNAKEAVGFARESGDIILSTIDGMNRIGDIVLNSSEVISTLGERSNEIGQIIQVINDIADQTNLLALNAAIEAARAGEQGLGFAVVADEVRKLAERTTRATKEISTMIQNIQKNTSEAVESISLGKTEVEKGKELAGRANDALRKIISNSENITAIIEQVASATEQQSVTSNEISKNIDEISNVSRNSAIFVDEIVESIEHHVKSTEEIQKLVAQFNVKKLARHNN